MGSIVSGIFANRAANRQADATTTAAAQQLAFQNRALDFQIQRGDEASVLFDPFIDRGENALAAYEYENGLRAQAPELSDGTRYGGYELTPDYEFTRDEGLDAIDRAFAARGQLNSGALEKARMRYASGLASQGRSEHLNRLAGLAAQGFGGTQAQANALLGTGSNVSNILLQQGNTQAAGTIGAANQRAAGLVSLGNIGTNFLNENLQVLGTTSEAFGNVAGGLSSFVGL